MLSAIADGDAQISGFLSGEDCLCTMAALAHMGVEIERPDTTTVIVHGKGLHGLSAPRGPLDMGNSGTAMRLICGLLSGQPFDSVLVGDASLSARPMNRVIRPLSSMGASIGSHDGKPPLSIVGGTDLSGIAYQMPIASAQVKSALLMAGLYADGTTRISEPAVTRDHTERMLESMGAVLKRSPGTIAVTGGQSLTAVDINVPADLSSAVFALVAAIIGTDCEVTVRDVGVNPTRTGALQILMEMGAVIELSNERLWGAEPVADITARSSTLTGIDVDPAIVSLAIDEFPVLFATAALAQGKTRFSGIGELRVKESDRIAAMAGGLECLGVAVSETDDGATVEGGALRGGTVQSFGDHRIAMAFAIAASRATDPVIIRDTDAVDTSFPGFADCVRALGVNIVAESEN